MARVPILLILLGLGAGDALGLALDERPARAGEWGFRPAEGEVLSVTPPAFSWRPQKKAAAYELEVAGPGGARSWKGIVFNVFCPPEELPPGPTTWRFRFHDAGGAPSPWSRARAFVVPEGAPAFPLPGRAALLARIPDRHPRLFCRPEELDAIRARAAGPGRVAFGRILAACEKALKAPPSTAEPALYPNGMKRGSEEWRRLWWGNREAVIRVLDTSAMLAFAGLVSGREDFRALAKKLLLEAARWNPAGATGYFYNDEAGMPAAYHFARTYTFLADGMSDEERALCRDVMAVRGREMAAHLMPRHLWTPYASHANRAWHFLGEVGVAFHGEIPEADDWVWFAANVFRCAYPVWSDDDGGWHEGMSYWLSYIGRFTWWAAVMKSALGLDAYRLPYFSKVGDYPLYLMPPGHRGGGFGDLCGNRASRDAAPLAALFAAQSGNGRWQWYADAHGAAAGPAHWTGFLSSGAEPPAPRPPDDLPSSRLFAGTGQAALNVTLLDARKNVQVLFKSSPFGSQSHGYEAQNAFLLNVGGERLFVRSGTRDLYGSEHHRGWMWETQSVNSVTVDGRGQVPHAREARGSVVEFHTGPAVDYVAGEGGGAYGGRLDAFTRRILFVKPDLVLLFDTLEAPKPARFSWHLHAAHPFEGSAPGPRIVRGERGAAQVAFLVPEDLRVTVTDRFDPPPRPRVQLTQWHLEAATAGPARDAVFLVEIRPLLDRDGTVEPSALRRADGGWIWTGPAGGGRAVALFRTTAGALAEDGFSTDRRAAVRVLDGDGRERARFESDEALEESF